MSDWNVIRENFHTKHSVFTAPDQHMPYIIQLHIMSIRWAYYEQMTSTFTQSSTAQQTPSHNAAMHNTGLRINCTTNIFTQSSIAQQTPSQTLPAAQQASSHKAVLNNKRLHKKQHCTTNTFTQCSNAQHMPSHKLHNKYLTQSSIAQQTPSHTVVLHNKHF